MSSGPAGGAVLDRGTTSSLADVVETVLDKGVVIDAQVAVGVLGIPLLDIDARVTIASVETYLRFAEAVDRLAITPREGPGLGGAVETVTDAARGLTSGLGGTVRNLAAPTGAPRGVLGDENGTDPDRGNAGPDRGRRAASGRRRAARPDGGN